MNNLLVAGHEKLISYTIIAQSIITISYLITTLFLINNYYSGFNTLVIGIIYILLIAIIYYYIINNNHNLDRTKYGGIIGIITILLFITLQNAIFYGQYSSCTTYNNRRILIDNNNNTFNLRRVLTYYPYCYNQSAMTAICVFSVLLFLLDITLLILLLLFKNDILIHVDENIKYSTVSTKDDNSKDDTNTITNR